MIRVNEILVYNHIKDIYYTDGKDIYGLINKEKNSKNYRVRYKNCSLTIDESNIEKINKITNREYIFDEHKLYRKRKWQKDKQGYNFIMSDPKGKPAKISQHRLIYFFNNNIKPNPHLIIDHINRIKDDNRIENLRLVTPTVNVLNIDTQKRKFNTSNYNIYQCYDLNNKLICEGYASDISEVIGINNGNIHIYAQKGFIFMNQYKIKFKEA